MDYAELIVRALHGRRVTDVAREWGVPQPTLHRYVNRLRMPDYSTAMKMAKSAGVAPGEAFEILAKEEELHKVKTSVVQNGFVQIDLLLLLATGGLYLLFLYYVKCSM